MIHLKTIRCGRRGVTIWIVHETSLVRHSSTFVDITIFNTLQCKFFHVARPSTVQSLLLLGYREFGIGSMEQGWIFYRSVFEYLFFVDHLTSF